MSDMTSEAAPASEDARREPENPSGPNGGSSVSSQPTVRMGESYDVRMPTGEMPQPAAALVPQVVPHESRADWQLEPRTMAEARQLAADLFASRLFSAYGNAPAVLSTILAGRELGLPAMASLRAFHIIEGRPTLSAGIIQAMVVKSPECEYFRCTERTNERATFTTKRRNSPAPQTLTFTMEDAKLAWTKGDTDAKRAESFAKSGYGKNPADMLVARAATKLARLEYPDVVSGLYAREEFD